MFKNLKKLSAIFSLLLLVMPICAENDGQTRLITVTGDADVRVAPDEVILTIGIETIDKELNTAKQENDKSLKKVINAAKKYGIESKHIQTDHISIEPRYEHYYPRRNFIGYFVRKNIVLTIRDISKFEDILSGILKAGANYVHGIQFRTTELRKFKDQARALAIKAAKEKAIALAEELEQEIGKPYSIQEQHSGWWSWYNSWWGSSWRSGTAQNVVQNIGSDPSNTESGIAPGQIRVNAKVTVSFELK